MLIFKSFPDLREFRHPALWLHFPPQRSTGDIPAPYHQDRTTSDAQQAPTAAAGEAAECFLIQITGSRGFFAYDCIPSDVSMTETGIPKPFRIDPRNDDEPVLSSSIINSSGVSHRPVPVKSVDIPFPEDLQGIDGGVIKTLILTALENTAIENADPEYNCQTWTELALRGLRDVGLLDEIAFERAVEDLVDGIWEAKDDEM
jgi:hypothetical protein